MLKGFVHWHSVWVKSQTPTLIVRLGRGVACWQRFDAPEHVRILHCPIFQAPMLQQALTTAHPAYDCYP